jgi:hypothetical protein
MHGAVAHHLGVVTDISVLGRDLALVIVHILHVVLIVI